MKVSTTDTDLMRTYLDAVLTPEAPNVYAEAGITHTRFRWDALHAADNLATRRDGLTLERHLYNHGYTDAHIDTALRHILGSAFTPNL
jgi:hypothetical protein